MTLANNKIVAGWYILILLCVTSCIKNDIPYPTVKLQITELTLEGQIGKSYINQEERLITVNLEEHVDLTKAIVKSVATTPGTKTDLIPGAVIDLSKPYLSKLSLYQDYTWTISASQQIDRRFSVKGQVGNSVFDVTSRRAIAYVSASSNLRKIVISELKLAPEGAILSPSDLKTTPQDFRTPREVSVVYRNVTEQWSLYVIPVDNPVSIKSVTPWAQVAWLSAEAEDLTGCGFEIRESDQVEWSQVDPSYLDFSETIFTARIPHLKPNTSYQVRAFMGNEVYSDPVAFVTYPAPILMDGSFDNWHMDGAIWNPWLETNASFWDTGNTGSTTLGKSNTYPTDDIWPGKNSGQAALLESRFVGFDPVGKFAAGNLFFGRFVRVDGTNGVLSLGRPFSSFPTRLKGYYKYHSTPISHASAEFSALKGVQDTCIVWAALGDWKTPVEIRTKPTDQKLFDKNDPNIIAYAEFCSGTSVNEYQELILNLEYRSKERIPTYLLIVASASKYGDYFTGGVGSILKLDEFSLEYDY